MNVWHMVLGGLLAGYAIVADYPAVGVSAVLALYVIFTIRKFLPIMWFLIAVSLPLFLLLAFNYKAFGHPFSLGYSYQVTPRFSEVHSASNPYGVRLPSRETINDVLPAIMWGRYRGLLFYAPVLFTSAFGLLVLLWRKQWGMLWIVVGAFVWIVAVNVSYPEWTGGWCTGPRFLVPSIPFAMIPVGVLLSIDRSNVLACMVGLLASFGTVVMLACVAIGGRFPPGMTDPVLDVVWPHWRGNFEAGHTEMGGGRQFERNLGRWIVEQTAIRHIVPAEPSAWQSIQILPLCVYWGLMIAGLVLRGRRGRSVTSRPT